MDRIADVLTDRAVRAFDRPLSRRGLLGRAVQATVALGMVGVGLHAFARQAKAACCVNLSCNNCPTGICTTGCCPSLYTPSFIGLCCDNHVEKGCWLCSASTGNCGCEVLTGQTC